MNTDAYKLEDMPTFERIVVRRERHLSKRQVMRNRSCSTKKRFHDPEQAHDFSHRLASKKGSAFQPQRIYRCPFCKGFHTTHKGIDNDKRREDSGHQGQSGEAQT